MIPLRLSLRLRMACLVVALPIGANAQGNAAVDFDLMRSRLIAAADLYAEKVRDSSQQARVGMLSEAAQGEAERRESSETGRQFPASIERVNETRAKLDLLGADASRTFAEHGVPLELLALAEVESGMNPLALSPKGARGLWQLMPGTAGRFGLRVDSQIDQRVQAMHSTRAAAKYLRELNNEFGDWLLALAAYNAGEARVRKAIKVSGEKDFWRLARRGLLPAETAAFVPAVLKAMGGQAPRTQQ
jgi:hypothetical protein